MNLDQVLAPVRPLAHVAGSIILIAGLLKFFGLSVPISGAGLEIAVAGYLLKSV